MSVQNKIVWVITIDGHTVKAIYVSSLSKFGKKVYILGKFSINPYF